MQNPIISQDGLRPVTITLAEQSDEFVLTHINSLQSADFCKLGEASPPHFLDFELGVAFSDEVKVVAPQCGIYHEFGHEKITCECQFAGCNVCQVFAHPDTKIICTTHNPASDNPELTSMLQNALDFMGNKVAPDDECLGGFRQAINEAIDNVGKAVGVNGRNEESELLFRFLVRRQYKQLQEVSFSVVTYGQPYSSVQALIESVEWFGEGLRSLIGHSASLAERYNLGLDFRIMSGGDLLLTNLQMFENAVIVNQCGGVENAAFRLMKGFDGRFPGTAITCKMERL